MTTAASVVWTIHAFLAALLLIHSIAYLGLAIARLRIRAAPAAAHQTSEPTVTVQIAVRNEAQLLASCLRYVERLEWPAHKLEIQILDDSDDPLPAKKELQRSRAAGHQTVLLQRPENIGEKAGALEHGLRAARGDVIVPFDVDFRPPADFLRRLLPHLSDPDVACVQSRWSTHNARRNLLTRALDLGMLGHFRVEQTVRAHHRGLTSFNATACAWRKTDLVAVGGWPATTLTEDLDVATRVRLRGRRFVHLEDLHCPAEVPSTVSALAVQQSRWARGSMHCFRLHAAAVSSSNVVPARRKLDILFHLGHYSLQPIIVASVLAQAALVLLQATPTWYAVASILPLLVGPIAMYVVALWLDGGARRLFGLLDLPMLALVGLGLTVPIAAHALLGLVGRRGRFRRTPKEGQRAQRAGHRLSCLVAAALVAAWAVVALPALEDPMAPGVLLFGFTALVAALAP